MNPIKEQFKKTKKLITQKAKTIEGPYMVTKEKQEEILRGARIALPEQEFFFIIDLKSFEVTHSEGSRKYLGYVEELSLEDHFKIRHPSQTKQYIKFGEIFLMHLMSGLVPLTQASYSSIVLEALQHANGKYSFTSRHSFPFQYNHQNQMTHYFSQVTILKTYNNEPFNHRFIRNGIDLPASAQEVSSIFIKKTIDALGLSEGQEKVVWVSLKDHHTTNRQLAERLEMSIKTIEMHKYRIRQKAEKHFNETFKTFSAFLSRLPALGI